MANLTFNNYLTEPREIWILPNFQKKFSKTRRGDLAQKMAQFQ